MSSLASVTRPFSVTISRPPSPSTRASTGTLTRVSGSCVMDRCLLAERLRVRIERTERADQVIAARAELAPACGERRGVRRLHRPEAAVAAPVEARAQRAAAGLRHRAEAGRAVRHHHAGVAGAFALDAHAMPADPRLAAVQVRGDHLEQLATVD